MKVAQHQSPLVHWQIGSIFPIETHQQIATTMSNRIHQPLIFSIDDRLSEQHLTRLDLSSKNLKRIDKLPNNINFNIILLDHNQISKLEHLENFPQLIQLSISHNQLIDIHALHRLRSIQKLNLSYNLIDSIDCLKTLQNLVMLNVSNNNISSIAALNTCYALQSLDASGNSIQQIEDLSQLISLKYLNFHKNFLDTLNSVPRYWPKSLHTLVISDNEIQDLTEISYLSSFINLNTLYIVDNPCLSVVDERRGCHQPFDYRPYILNWCLSIHNLDEIFITRKESLKAEWLLSQGKGRSFGPGEHTELIQYLTRVCGIDPDEKDDLNLSRIMLQEDLYNQQRQSEHMNTTEQMMTTSDTIRDANETLSKNSQGRLQQSTLISESEFIKINTSSSTSADEEHTTSAYQRQMRTPSPGCTRSTSVGATHIDDQITENSSSNRYTKYDNRPIKPLDQNMLQTKLNQYPVDNYLNDTTNNSRSRSHSNPQQNRRTASHLIYNANRYSPKTATHGPTASSTLLTESNQNLAKQHHNRVKHRRRNSTDTDALWLVNHPYEIVRHHSATTDKVEAKQQQQQQQQLLTGTSSGNQNQHTDDDDDEIQLKSAPVNAMYSTQSTTMNNTVELQRLTASVETMRTSVLQAYLDLHERFTKTTELQTSALTSLWKKYETQTLTHQRDTEKIIQENRLLNQRIHELESRLNINQSNSVIQSSTSTPKHNPNLHPPLRAHISKRDAKSFFLHWIPNPLNEHHTILGYRIYIDDVLKGAIDPGRFEAIIDYIRDEGEYRIKIRTYDQHGESADSNIVAARFRRQHPTTPSPDSAMPIHRTQSAHTIGDIHERQTNENLILSSNEQIKTPIIMNKRRNEAEQKHDNIPTKSDEHISQIKRSPQVTTNDYTITHKPPKSPTSSPSRAEKKSSNSGSSSKVLFDNNTNDSSSSVITKRSPTRTGIMSRLTKSSYKLKQNNIPLNAFPIESTNTSKTQVTTAKRVISFQNDPNSSDHEPLPIRSSSEPLTSVNIRHLVTRSDTLSSSSPSPPPVAQRIAKDNATSSLNQ